MLSIITTLLAPLGDFIVKFGLGLVTMMTPNAQEVTRNAPVIADPSLDDVYKSLGVQPNSKPKRNNN